MPDENVFGIFDPRDPGAQQRRQQRIQRYDEAMIENGHDTDDHLDPAAIAACALCDADGYRPNGTVCDHIDRADIAARGAAACRAALSKLPKTETSQ